MRQLKHILIIGSVVMLTACELPAIRGSIDSGVNRLQTGMSVEDVRATIGPSQFVALSRENPDLTCRSYIYDEAIDGKFAHVLFLDGKVIEASDNHRSMCQIP